LPPNPV